MSRTRSVRLVAGLATAAAIVVLPASQYAFAKGGGKGGGNASNAAAACSASPSPLAVGSDYTLNATGLPANTAVSVYVTDRMGTQWTNGMTSSAGGLSVSEHASYSGTYTAKVTTGAMTASALASCSFSAS